MYKMSLVHLCIKPRQTCQHLQIGNHTKPLIHKQIPLFLNILQHKCLTQLKDFTFFPVAFLFTTLHQIPQDLFLKASLCDSLHYHNQFSTVNTGHHIPQFLFLQISLCDSLSYHNRFSTVNTHHHIPQFLLL